MMNGVERVALTMTPTMRLAVGAAKQLAGAAGGEEDAERQADQRAEQRRTAPTIASVSSSDDGDQANEFRRHSRAPPPDCCSPTVRAITCTQNVGRRRSATRSACRTDGRRSSRPGPRQNVDVDVQRPRDSCDSSGWLASLPVKVMRSTALPPGGSCGCSCASSQSGAPEPVTELTKRRVTSWRGVAKTSKVGPPRRCGRRRSPRRGRRSPSPPPSRG